MTEQGTVVAISRQLGAGGSIVGRSIARTFGWRYADREILHEASRRLHADDAELAALEERVETVWERLAPLFLFGVSAGPAIPPLPPALTGPGLFAVEREILQSLAARGSVVIVGRGGAHVLRDHPGLVTVFLHADELVRTERLAERLDATQRHHAADLVRQSDRQRSEFNKSLSGRDWTDATQYDLSIDTSAADLNTIGDVVAALLTTRGFAPADAPRQHKGT